MDDLQHALIIGAIREQTNALNRIGDIMFGLMLHIAPEQARKVGAPNYMRKLEEYGGFDWASIGATVAAEDKHGACEVEHNGNVYRRYRSSDDDPKGTDIRFRRVAAGTVDEKNMVWVTLIKFADQKDRKPPRALRGEVAERVEDAAKRATMAHPVAPPPVTSPAPSATPDDPFARWTSARKLVTGELPEWLLLATGDTVPTINARTQALVEFAAAPSEAQSELLRLSNEHLALVAKAKQIQLPLGNGLSVLPPTTRLIEVSAVIATLKNIITAEHRKRGGNNAPTVMPTGAPVTQPALGQGGPRSATQVREWFENSVKANVSARPASDIARNSTYAALRSACAGNDAKLHMVVKALCGVESYKDIPGAKLLALHAWLKPATGGKPANPNATTEVEALLSAVEVTA